MITAIARYWGKKPPGLIRQLLREDDEVVVDPFGGAGAIAQEAVRAGKRVIYSDVNPYAWLITHVAIAGADKEEFQEAVSNVLSRAVMIEPRIKRSALTRDWLRYPGGAWFLKRRVSDRVTGFFPRENVRRLLALLRAIDETEASINTKLALYLAFANALHLSSYMRRPSGGAWAVPCYWVGPVSQPLNAYEAFKRAAARLFNALVRPRPVCYSLECGGDVVLLLKDALSLKYKRGWTLITDPPFGEDIQYMELSFFYWAWLRTSQLPRIMRSLLGARVTYPFSRELVVNKARGVGVGEYLARLRVFLTLTRRMRRKVLVFDGEDEDLVVRVRELVREVWGEHEERVVAVDAQRRLGAGRGVRYLVIEA